MMERVWSWKPIMFGYPSEINDLLGFIYKDVEVINAADLKKTADALGKCVVFENRGKK